MSHAIKVMIIDDSALVRQVVAHALDREPGIEVIATAADPVFAIGKLRQQWPDVIVLDIEMPRMDGLSFLRKIMTERPTPVIICSSLVEAGARATFEAMAAGAVTVIAKPKAGLKSFLNDASTDIAHAVRAAARVNLHALPRGTFGNLRSQASTQSMIQPGAPAAIARTTDQLIAIGTSTGGTHALEVVLTHLPATCLGIVVVQHMPEKFTAMFAERLNGLCDIEVREAKNGDRVIPGLALIAPGGRHMTVKRSGAQYVVEVTDGPLVNRHKPSVDVLFRSVAKFVGRNALGIIMTGMGDDGARGMKEMHDAGATTIAQDEQSCVVFGMPKEAIKLDAVDQVIPLDRIATAITSYGKGI
ncbi:protein-glutamate methylesterase/protein-glutamine glutaminase [Dechloromonas denitrificans]|uniref:protein-glutamate methylesterase/protein-glutamine glutaminase n=1 Tax=Dechloromonas denitrificans TaxID=281362 RepID=UPI001CF81BF5|nr:chemotaxis response regulator protein-glutamate methylesterase [Dechloromonas denitrificans]UCV04182.1 chemotaxis response regulator protein-glutamate methylesterase [Dechloromonas denitrificans]